MTHISAYGLLTRPLPDTLQTDKAGVTPLHSQGRVTLARHSAWLLYAQPHSRMHVTVFDIDGTLTDSCAFDDMLYAEAVREILHVEISCRWQDYRDVTDSGILNEVLDGCGFSGCRTDLHMRVKENFVNRLRRYMERHPVREIPGAKELVDKLRRHRAISVAIATGGWHETAVLKLDAIGLDPHSIPMATASDSSNRCAILRIAVNRASNGRPATRTTYFGDGEWDMRAAAELQYEFIAVGSKVRHHRVVPDLVDHAAILRELGA